MRRLSVGDGVLIDPAAMAWTLAALKGGASDVELRSGDASAKGVQPAQLSIREARAV
jgi:hypothetical protein